jgi:hypothetical protein
MDSSPKVASSSSYSLGSGRGDSLKNPARVKNISVLYILIDVQKPLRSQTVGAFVLPAAFVVKPAPLYHIVEILVKCKSLTVLTLNRNKPVKLQPPRTQTQKSPLKAI